METPVKYCRKCSRYLEYKSFHKSKNKSYIDGHISICKSCVKNKVVRNDEKPVFKIIKEPIIISFN